MIIDTNGFKIGDEVWYISYFLGDTTLESFRISEFHITNMGTVAIGRNKNSMLNDFCNIKSLYHSQSDCQLACDRLNGISHD